MARKHLVFKTDRFGSLSDGVFAIAMTLLVLDLKMPDNGDLPFIQVFTGMLSRIEAWIFSFFVIGALWILHHNVLSLLKRTTTTFLWMNIFFLMFIAFMPWPAWLIGEYRTSPYAIMLFSGTVGMAGLVVQAQWLYAASGSRLTDKNVNLQTMKVTTWLNWRIPLVASLSILMAFLHIKYALVVWILHSFIGVGIKSWYHWRGEGPAEAADAV
ncbi:MAG: TMEM175 family protein [bacterium]|nr:TMEM175 family protein [bacterium]